MLDPSLVPLKKILVPPPNVTGKFHYGHFVVENLSYFLQEFLISFGYKVKTVFGWDHAGLSAEKKIDPNRLMSRVELLKKLRLNTLLKILNFNRQLRLWGINFKGISKFSLDQDFQKCTENIYYRLLREKIIISRKVFVNMVPYLGRAVPDDDLEIKEEKKTLYTLKFYLLDNPNEALEVSTTMPLTVASDIALCFNPADKRYSHLIGKKVLSPIFEDVIPLVAYDLTSMTYGSGLMKVTPTMDRNDFLISEKLGLEKGKPCLNSDGTFSHPTNKNCRYNNLDWDIAEQRYLWDLKDRGFLKSEIVSGKTKKINLSGKKYKVMDLLREEIVLDLPVLSNSIESETLNINPVWAKRDFTSWLKRVEYWCLSRDISWGTQILKPWRTILDTWFNASLWPIIEGPFDYLITGCDLIFFWYLKMNAMSFHINSKPAISKVFFHGLVVDTSGQKMSKSKGNILDPDAKILEIGREKARLAVLSSINQAKTIKLDFEDNRIFKLINKIRNVGSFLNSRPEIAEIKDEFIIAANNSILLYYVEGARNIREAIINLRMDKLFDLLNSWVKGFSGLQIDYFKLIEDPRLLRTLKWSWKCYMRSMKVCLSESWDLVKAPDSNILFLGGEKEVKFWEILKLKLDLILMASVRTKISIIEPKDETVRIVIGVIGTPLKILKF